MMRTRHRVISNSVTFNPWPIAVGFCQHSGCGALKDRLAPRHYVESMKLSQAGIQTRTDCWCEEHCPECSTKGAA